MDKRKYTSGEIAAAAGLTIRAVQHYDNIGLLCSAPPVERRAVVDITRRRI